jgi:hypothetical protein
MNNEDISEVLTEQELKEEWQEEINEVIKDFKSGECAEVDMISDFCADIDYTPDKLIDCIFNPQKAEKLLKDYRNYVTKYYQGFIENYTLIEKKIQVEI